MLTILVCLLGLFAVREQVDASGETNVILRWAPVIYQQDNRQNPVARENVFALVNNDRDWRLNNNWINLPYHSPSAAVYYSLVESDTHYFIGYYLYYPRHTGKAQHEHDMVGVLTVVRKGCDAAGHLDLLLSYSYSKWNKWEGSHVRLENGHPTLLVSAGTHEISAVKLNEPVPGPGGVYRLPSAGKVSATSSQAGTTSHTGYQLVDLQELWERRNDIGQGHTFRRWGYFDSYYYLNAAVPWVWEYNRINWLAKPAELVQLMRGMPKKPETYLHNPYLSIH